MKLAVNAKAATATMSPRAAANGMAKLSGFSFSLFAIRIMTTNRKAENEG
jgi:hypothetical protein